MKSEDVSNQGLLQQLRMGRFAEGLAQEGFAEDLSQARRRGQLQLDSIYNDYSPLLRGLG
jgi:hypothetical protein